MLAPLTGNGPWDRISNVCQLELGRVTGRCSRSTEDAGGISDCSGDAVAHEARNFR